MKKCPLQVSATRFRCLLLASGVRNSPEQRRIQKIFQGVTFAKGGDYLVKNLVFLLKKPEFLSKTVRKMQFLDVLVK